MRKVVSDCPVPTTLASPASEPSRVASGQSKKDEGLAYVVPKGYFVLAAPGVSMVDPEIWGDDAGEFKETRWLEGGKGLGLEKEEGDGGEEEDYGWGKISKGGKSACMSPSFCMVLCPH
jgi:sterol 14-demethylase